MVTDMGSIFRVGVYVTALLKNVEVGANNGADQSALLPCMYCAKLRCAELSEPSCARFALAPHSYK